MHFKNQRPAQNGDPVVTRNYAGKIVSGVIFNLQETTASCNVDVAVVIPGGIQQLTCRDVGQMFHAEDAFLCLDNATLAAAGAGAPAAPAASDEQPAAKPAGE